MSFCSYAWGLVFLWTWGVTWSAACCSAGLVHREASSHCGWSSSLSVGIQSWDQKMTGSVFTLVPPQPPKTRPSEPVQCWYKKHNNLQLAFTRDEDYKTFNCTYNEANTCGQLNMRWLSSLWVRDFMMSNKESCSQHDEYVGVFTVRVDVAAINNSVWIHLLTLSFVQIIVLFVVIIQCFVSQTFYSISCSVLIE